MTSQVAPTPERHVLDYEIADTVDADTPQAMKALGDTTRISILGLLLERAATTSHLADALDKPKGTVGYHLKVLEDAGLIRIVRTRKVRAMTEKYYGRVGRTIVYGHLPEKGDPFFMITQAIRDARIVEGEPLPMVTLRRARIPADRALEFSRRVIEIAEDFTELPQAGDTVYAFLAGVFPTDLPTLSGDEE